MDFATPNSSQNGLQIRGLDGLRRTEASVGRYFGPGMPVSTFGSARVGSGVERIRHSVHRMQTPYYRQLLHREPPVPSNLPQHVNGSTTQLSTRNVHHIQHRGNAVVGGSHLAPIPELPSHENTFDFNALPKPRACGRSSLRLPLASATNALTLGHPWAMAAPGEGTRCLYPTHPAPNSATTVYITPPQIYFPSLSNVVVNGRTAPAAVDPSWCGSQLDTASSSRPYAESTSDSVLTVTETSPVTPMNEFNDIMPAGLLFVDELLGQNTQALQTKGTTNTASNSGQLTSSDQAPEKALSLNVIFDLSYGNMKDWDVSLPVSTFTYEGGPLSSCVYSYYAMKPARSSIEIVVGIGADTTRSVPEATENRDQVANTALHSHSLYVSAKPFVSPMEVINNKPDKFEYKFVLSIFSVLEGLHKGLNKRLSATHWKTLSIEEKFFLIKALCMRRSGRLFPADIAAVGEAKARMVSVCKGTNSTETRVAHAMLDAYAFPLEEKEMISKDIPGVLVLDYLGGKNKYRGLKLGKDDKFILHTD